MNECAATTSAGLSRPKLKFRRDRAFRDAVNRRVDAHFAATGLRRQDLPAFYLKVAILVPILVAAYVLLVFADLTTWQSVLLAIVLAAAINLVAFNIFHDAGHSAASRHRAVNYLGLVLMDLTGVSSYVWLQRHNMMHHAYPNVHDYDCDIDVGPLLRLSPHQPHLWLHRFQHIYLWPLYGLHLLKWQFIDDVVPLITGRLGALRFRRPRGYDLAHYLLGKTAFVVLAFVIPMSLHAPAAVLGLYLLIAYVNGMIFVYVVQLSHLVECTETPRPSQIGAQLDSDWAVHQVEASCDFSQQNRVLSWLLGGLNFQVEHHLFPKVCHVHYPALAPIVRDACREFDVPYNTHASVLAGLRSHHRFLRHLGQASA